MDLMDKYTPTVKGHQYILKVSDQFIGYVMAVPVINITAESVNITFIHAVLCVFDAPTMLLSDNAS